MKTLTNPTEFYNIHKNEKAFIAAKSNMEIRFFISSYGFRATREIADLIDGCRRSL